MKRILALTLAVVMALGLCACGGGGSGGAGCPPHEEKSRADVDRYGREAMEKTIADALSLIK